MQNRSMSERHIRLALPSDHQPLIRLREALWPESSPQEHTRELQAILERKYSGAMPLVIFVAEDTDGKLIGFLEVGLRSHADGCDPAHPVGFIEGWFVKDHDRRKGIGRQLLKAAEDWARRYGCVEMASDTWIDQIISQHVHEALGFTVVDRCVHYRKPL